MVAIFRKIDLKGDFYNAIRSIAVGGGMDANGGMRPPTGVSGSNLVLSFDDASVTGRITASAAQHLKNPIAAADYQSLGEVTNTPQAAINNGVLVSLHHSTWIVTGTSYLTSLTIDERSVVKTARGNSPTMRVDGVVVPARPGTYRGNIVVD